MIEYSLLQYYTTTLDRRERMHVMRRVFVKWAWRSSREWIQRKMV